MKINQFKEDKSHFKTVRPYFPKFIFHFLKIEQFQFQK